MPKIGINSTFVSLDDPDNLKNALTDKTKLVSEFFNDVGGGDMNCCVALSPKALVKQLFKCINKAKYVMGIFTKIAVYLRINSGLCVVIDSLINSPCLAFNQIE